MSFALYGPLITPLNPRRARYIPKALLYIEDGAIQWVEEGVEVDDLSDVLLLHGLGRGIRVTTTIKLQRGQFLMPGFIDTHTHAPQFPNLGRGGEYELLDWLDNLTFPTEAKFTDKEHAKAVYTEVVNRLLNCGTTTCCYFSSVHVCGTKVLADIVSHQGQRAFVGYCNMDRNAPDFYLGKNANHSQSLEETRHIIQFIKSLNNALVQPILTPRFAIACTGELLKGLGDIAGETSREDPGRPLLIQTHISENLSEIDFTAALFPEHSSYAHIYAEKGLLRPTTILAHGCHLTLDELDLIKAANAGISHCPTSNFHLNSGVANVNEWIDMGIKVGLGTDVSGGFSPSMLTAIQHASIASKIVPRLVKKPDFDTPSIPNTPNTSNSSSSSRSIRKSSGLSNATLLYLATLGGAELCNIQDRVGSLEPGKEFDAMLVDLSPEMGNPKVWWDSTPDLEVPRESFESKRACSNTSSIAELECLLEKFFFCGDDRNIVTVFVSGKVVGGQSNLGLGSRNVIV